MSKYTLQGTVQQVGDVQSFSSGFTKREILVTEHEEKYPQTLKFELFNDKTTLADHLQQGDEVTVHFNIRGNEHNGKHYVALQAWKIESDAPAREAQNPAQRATQAAAPTQPDDDCDDIPF